LVFFVFLILLVFLVFFVFLILLIFLFVVTIGASVIWRAAFAVVIGPSVIWRAAFAVVIGPSVFGWAAFAVAFGLVIVATGTSVCWRTSVVRVASSGVVIDDERGDDLSERLVGFILARFVLGGILLTRHVLTEE
jgi:hypothetical protein